MHPKVTAFFDEATFIVSYVVAKPMGKHCVIIDSVLDYDPKADRTATKSADEILGYVSDNDLTVD